MSSYCDFAKLRKITRKTNCNFAKWPISFIAVGSRDGRQAQSQNGQNHDGFIARSTKEHRTMLVLSRKESESIILTDNSSGREIVIKLVAISGNRARIGIEADMQVKVLREELREAS